MQASKTLFQKLVSQNSQHDIFGRGPEDNDDQDKTKVQVVGPTRIVISGLGSRRQATDGSESLEASEGFKEPSPKTVEAKSEVDNE